MTNLIKLTYSNDSCNSIVGCEVYLYSIILVYKYHCIIVYKYHCIHKFTYTLLHWYTLSLYQTKVDQINRINTLPLYHSKVRTWWGTATPGPAHTLIPGLFPWWRAGKISWKLRAGSCELRAGSYNKLYYNYVKKNVRAINLT